MFFLDLKRADVAIRSGRLDEAFELLQGSSDRGHRDGHKLVDRLSEALLQRATRHLKEGRVDDARQDGNKLLQLAGRKPDVTELLQKIAVAEQAKRDRQQQRNDVLATAEEQVRAGAYSIGAKLLAPLEDDQSVSNAVAKQRLAQSIDAKKAVVTHAAERIQAAIDAGDYERAIDVVAGLKADQRAHVSIEALLPKAIQPLVECGLNELASGRLDRAAVTMRLLQPLQSTSASIGELQQSLERCLTIREHLLGGRYAEAENELTVLERVIDSSDWISSTRTAVAAVIQNLGTVMSGPLALLSHEQWALQCVAKTVIPTQPDNQMVPSQDKFSPTTAEDHLPARSVLQVDALGSMLLLTSDIVTIGASSRQSAFDVALMTEGETVPITIRRDGDDYFAESSATFQVNGHQVTRKLLASGDTLTVGSRGRLRFMKPVAASGSALLQITGSRLARRDIRSVVLMADSLLFGPNGSHFRLPDVDAPIVLHGNRDGYAVRQLGHTGTSAVRLGESAVVNDVRFGLVEA